MEKAKQLILEDEGEYSVSLATIIHQQGIYLKQCINTIEENFSEF